VDVRVDGLVKGLVETALRWIDVDHSDRIEAEEVTLEAGNRFTPEALAFAINQQMSTLLADDLDAWSRRFHPKTDTTYALLMAGNIPLVGLQDLIAVILSGGRAVVVLSRKSPALIPAFVREWAGVCPDLPITFGALDEALDQSDGVIAAGSDRTMSMLRSRIEQARISERHSLLRGHRYSIAIIDSSWKSEDYACLAEDLWLHEGLGCRNVAIVWAPEDLMPDYLLTASAEFRGVFPAHPDSRGALELQRAFLTARNIPHAHGEGLEFLISRGRPEVLGPGHVRWTPYGDSDQVREWIQEHEDEIQIVVSAPGSRSLIPGSVAVVDPGNAQRPELGWVQDGVDLAAFLTDVE